MHVSLAIYVDDTILQKKICMNVSKMHETLGVGDTKIDIIYTDGQYVNQSQTGQHPVSAR